MNYGEAIIITILEVSSRLRLKGSEPVAVVLMPSEILPAVTYLRLIKSPSVQINPAGIKIAGLDVVETYEAPELGERFILRERV